MEDTRTCATSHLSGGTSDLGEKIYGQEVIMKDLSGCLFIIGISYQSEIRDLSVLLMRLAHGRGSINT